MGTGCPGRPGAPGLAGNLDCGAPGRAAGGRTGAGGFTRAPGGNGFQLGFGAEAFVGATGWRTCAPGLAEAAGLTPAGGAEGTVLAPAGVGFAATGWGVAAGRTIGFAGGATVGADAAGRAGAGGAAGAGFSTGAGGTTAGATGFATTGGGATTGGAAATGAGGAATAGGCGEATEGGFKRAALAAASFAAFSATAFCSAATSASAISRKCLRTLTAASTSIELECVFFSVTPASGK